jgi:hypothetical protein
VPFSLAAVKIYDVVLIDPDRLWIAGEFLSASEKRVAADSNGSSPMAWRGQKNSVASFDHVQHSIMASRETVGVAAGF